MFNDSVIWRKAIPHAGMLKGIAQSVVCDRTNRLLARQVRSHSYRAGGWRTACG
jgi:hypothetical protein